MSGTVVGAPAPDARETVESGPERTADDARLWRRGPLPAALGVVTALALAGHRTVPDPGLGLRSLWESVLPWSVLVALVLLGWATLRRAPAAACAAGLLAVVWAVMFGPLLTAGQAAAGGEGLTVVTHNVMDGNRDPAASARALLAARPDLVALEEVTERAWPAYQEVIGAALPHHVRSGTVGLWSKHPFAEAGRLVIDPGWNRSLRAEVRTPFGPVAVYVAHLSSVRPHVTGFVTGHRDGNIAALAREVAAEPVRRVVVLGDLNTAPDDHALAPLTGQLALARGGFGFTWPAAFPVARIDHVLTRGLTADTWTLPATASDHLPLAGRLRP
ncbi:endonuclease/exonuclease/phosphatase family protein [Kitasatospora albolonga]|uniref:endonuclease/exonuclease/phosphatase family protein n=1 Tax=Kitasatospora albolonga TaxID=68173 RepID=UPI0031E9C0DC